MIIVGDQFLSAEHIEHIHVQQISSELHTVVVQMTGNSVVFGRDRPEVMDKKMAFELHNRIISAIIKYKSSDPPRIQIVDIPKIEEFYSQKDTEMF